MHRFDGVSLFRNYVPRFAFSKSSCSKAPIEGAPINLKQIEIARLSVLVQTIFTKYSSYKNPSTKSCFLVLELRNTTPGVFQPDFCYSNCTFAVNSARNPKNQGRLCRSESKVYNLQIHDPATITNCLKTGIFFKTRNLKSHK